MILAVMMDNKGAAKKAWQKEMLENAKAKRQEDKKEKEAQEEAQAKEGGKGLKRRSTASLQEKLNKDNMCGCLHKVIEGLSVLFEPLENFMMIINTFFENLPEAPAGLVKSCVSKVHAYKVGVEKQSLRVAIAKGNRPLARPSSTGNTEMEGNPLVENVDADGANVTPLAEDEANECAVSRQKQTLATVHSITDGRRRFAHREKHFGLWSVSGQDIREVQLVQENSHSTPCSASMDRSFVHQLVRHARCARRPHHRQDSRIHSYQRLLLQRIWRHHEFRERSRVRSS
eukprot:gb/GFBE01035636.1/.p1 GENE.gb/GFBE01035636.1/~~gb/GFBE01035636.1/.p1  ORF type:complete len:287 (+),score=55.86 gb/GFBE01035636.1/:1-861(+)